MLFLWPESGIALRLIVEISRFALRRHLELVEAVEGACEIAGRSDRAGQSPVATGHARLDRASK